MMRSISWMGHVSLMQKLLQLTLLSTGRKTSLSQPTEKLERHQQWLERHSEVYLKELKWAKRRLRRHDLIRACKQAVMVPMQLVSYGFVALLPGARRTLANRAKYEQLQNRINAVDRPR